MAWLVKCSLHKRSDLHSDPQDPQDKPDMGACACNSSTWQAESGGPLPGSSWPASLTELGSFSFNKKPSLKIKGGELM